MYILLPQVISSTFSTFTHAINRDKLHIFLDQSRYPEGRIKKKSTSFGVLFASVNTHTFSTLMSSIITGTYNICVVISINSSTVCLLHSAICRFFFQNIRGRVIVILSKRFVSTCIFALIFALFTTNRRVPIDDDRTSTDRAAPLIHVGKRHGWRFIPSLLHGERKQNLSDIGFGMF